MKKYRIYCYKAMVGYYFYIVDFSNIILYKGYSTCNTLDGIKWGKPFCIITIQSLHNNCGYMYTKDIDENELFYILL